MTVSRASLATLFAITLAACGGGNDTAATPAPASAPAVTITPAPLVVSAATPATVNGTLDKTLILGQNEAGISDSVGNFSGAGPNDYCRAAIYQMNNTGDSKKYFLEVVFSKATREVTYVRLAEDATPSGFTARAAAPITTVSVDIANRSIGFTNTVLGATGVTPATLNGTMEYSTNAVVSERGNCG